MPTLGGAEDAEILLPLPLAANAAEIRNREDYNIIGHLEAGCAIVAGAERSRMRSRRGCGASFPTSTRPTAA